MGRAEDRHAAYRGSTAEAGKLRHDGGRSTHGLSGAWQHQKLGKFPNLTLDRAANSEPGTRLAISNKNVPKMLGQILSHSCRPGYQRGRYAEQEPRGRLQFD